MTFTDELAIIPIDEKGIEIAIQQIQADIECGRYEKEWVMARLEAIEAIQKRVIECREYLKTL